MAFRISAAVKDFQVRARDATDEALLDLVTPAIDALFPETETTATPMVGSDLRRFEVAVRGQLSLIFADGLHEALSPHLGVRATEWLTLGVACWYGRASGSSFAAR